MKTILCRWFNWHLRWSRREGSYLQETIDGGEQITSTDLKQCGLCGVTIVRAHESKTTELVYDAEHQSTASDVFQRAQLLGFEGSRS